MKVSQVAVTATLAVAVQAQADASCTSFFTDTCIFEPFTQVAINSFSCSSGDLDCYCSNSASVANDVGFLDACINGADAPLTYASFCSCVTDSPDVVTTTTSADEVTTTTDTDTGIVTPTDTDTGVETPTDTDTGVDTPTDTGVPPVGKGTSTGSSKSSGSGPGSTVSKSNGGITPPGASPTLTGTTVVPIGSATKTSISIPKFTGAAGTASAFMPIGGVLGAVVGLVAVL